MLRVLSDYFSSSGFTPHGYCFVWEPTLLWVDVISDLVTATSYLSIPFALWYFVHKRPDIPFRWMFLMFGVFVLACGSTHLFAAWNIWHADYWAEAAAKALTAGVSAASAILLWPLIPKALTIPSHAQLESANRELQSEVTRRFQAENALVAANDALERRVAERTTELEQSNDALRESEARFRSLTEMSSDFYWETDAEHRLTTRGMGGDKPSTVSAFQRGTQIGERRWEIPYLSPDEAGWRAHRAVLDAHRRFRDFRLSRRGVDGSERFILISGDPVFDASGAFKGYRGVGADITERKVAEDALHASEEKFAKAFRASPMFISISTVADGRYIDVNEGFLRATGHTREEVVGHTSAEIGLWKNAEDRQRAIDTLQKNSRITRFEALLCGKSGEPMACEIWGEPIVIGDKPCIIWVTNDITERKAAEAKIQRLTQLYAALSQCNQAIVRCTGQEELFAQICLDAVEYGGMKMAWIGLIDPDTRMIRVEACFGERAAEYVQGIEISVDAGSPLARGPSGVAILENHPVWWQDFQSQPHTAPWHGRRAQFGWGASGSLPLHRNGVAIGIINVYAGEPGAFDDEARQLLTEMATDISFALDNFAREASRKQAEADLRAAEGQFRGLVEQSVAGVYIVQDGKFAYVNPRTAEIIGHGAPEKLVGSDPLQWIAAAERGRVAQNMSRLLEGEAQSIAMDFAAVRGDGMTIQIGGNAARATHKGRPAIIGMMQDISEKRRAEDEIRRYVEQLKTAFMSTVDVATSLSEMRDPYTAGHERRVGKIAAAIGAELGLDEQRVEGLRVAGCLHDIGKITIPAEILSKPGKLSQIEYELIKAHPQSSYDVLKDVKFPWPVAEVALQHHERLDGSGYPRGLKGEAILLEARIMAVADVMEAMSSHRPYRPGLGIEHALAEVERGRGTVYDASVVQACLRLFREKRFQLPA